MKALPMLTHGITNQGAPQCDSARPGSAFNPIRHTSMVCLGRFDTIDEARRALELFLMPAKGNA